MPGSSVLVCSFVGLQGRVGKGYLICTSKTVLLFAGHNGSRYPVPLIRLMALKIQILTETCRGYSKQKPGRVITGNARGVPPKVHNDV